MVDNLQKPPSLAEQAYTIVEQLIVTLELPPGSSFSEAELSRRVDIGRTPLREALQRLSADRLVTTLPRRGMIVSEINIADQLTLLETRRVLDRLIAARAALRADDLQRTRLQALSRKITTAAAGDHIAEFMALDHQVDQLLALASRNPFAADAVAPMHSHCRRFWYYYRNNGDLGSAAAGHRHLVESVVNGDDNAAGAASDQLIDYLEQFTRSALDM